MGRYAYYSAKLTPETNYHGSVNIGLGSVGIDRVFLSSHE